MANATNETNTLSKGGAPLKGGSFNGGWKAGAVVALALGLVVVGVLVYSFVFKRSSSGGLTGGALSSGAGLKSARVEKITSDKANFALSYQSASGTAKLATVITNFEDDNEKWQGGGVYDNSLAYEGNNSLNIVSVDRSEKKTYLKKDLDLSNMDYLEFMLYINDENAFEYIYVDLGDSEMKNYYSYSLSNINTGWNLIQIPKKQFVSVADASGSFDWSKIQKVLFRVSSRVDAILMARIDLLHTINDYYSFTKDWNVAIGKEKYGLSVLGNKNSLLVRNWSGVSALTLDKVKNATDFIFEATVSPQAAGRSGLFVRGNYNNGYGYYFLIGGLRSNMWQIQKLGKNGWLTAGQVISGDIGNDVFQYNKDYTLRVEVKGSSLKFYLSFDGKKYYELGELKDSEFRSGGVGMAVLDGTWSLFDDFIYKEL